MKASTWSALALCLGRALQSEGTGGDLIGQCDVVCDAIKSEISSAEACAKARKSLPRPKIGRVCQEAFEKALELTCVEACQQHGTGRVPESRLGEACDKRRREVPRPVAHKACVDGFNAGFTATTAFIAERVELPTQEPQMDEETKAALLEQHNLILEEVAAEFDYFVELDSPDEAEQAQNVDVSKLGGSTEGVLAGTMESTASAAGLTLRGVDENRASVPLREGRDMLEKDASSGKGDSTIPITRLGPEFMEVFKAEHVKGFKGASRDKSIDNQVGEESVKVPGPAEKKGTAAVSSEANLVMELPQDGRFREVLTVDHIKAYNNPSSGDKPRSNRGGSRPAGIVPGPAEEKETAGVSSEANLVTELPQDGRFQEVLTVDHVKAYNNEPRNNHGRSHPADATSRTEDVPASGAVELEDFVTLGRPEPPLSANEKRLQALSAKEAQPRDMQEDEDAALESEGNN